MKLQAWPTANLGTKLKQKRNWYPWAWEPRSVDQDNKTYWKHTIVNDQVRKDAEFKKIETFKNLEMYSLSIKYKWNNLNSL